MIRLFMPNQLRLGLRGAFKIESTEATKPTTQVGTFLKCYEPPTSKRNLGNVKTFLDGMTPSKISETG